MHKTKSKIYFITIALAIVFLIVNYLIYIYSEWLKSPVFILIPSLLVISIILIYLLNKNVAESLDQNQDIDKAKNDFVSLASHQLCTPLSAISWYSEMLLSGDGGELSKEQRKYVQTIYHSTKRMILLVNALLNVSRIDLGTFAIEPELTDIRSIAEKVISELPPIIKDKKINISKKYAENLPKIMADPSLVKLIFQNVLSNAIKYTPEDGNVDFSITKKEGNILIKIKDSGCGIPEEQKSRVFTKLFRADNVRRLETDGTGLGLYIVKSILDYSGGKIWFESQENKGTTFYITLPLSGMKKKSGTKRLG